MAVLWGGGYAPAARSGFCLLAALALLAAVRESPELTVRLARQPVLVVLWALGGLGLASVAWTIGSPGDTVRWGLVTLAYGAVAVAAGVMAGRPSGAGPIAIGICGLAFVSGVVGLVATALATGPFADQVAGAWRPGGTLEYSSALALLQVSALPVLFTGLTARPPIVRVAAALGGVVAAMVLALAGSRLELGLAAIVVVVGIVRSPVILGLRRGVAASAVGALTLVGLIAVATFSGSQQRKNHQPPTVIVTTRVVRTDSDFWHGRRSVWQEALRVAQDRPVLGAGADAFLLASLPYVKGDAVTFAHDLPLEMAAELGIGGLLLALALYLTSAQVLWRARRSRAAWLLGPAVGAFLMANLLDWPWHLAGSGAVWAAALGGLLGVRRPAASPPTGDAGGAQCAAR